MRNYEYESWQEEGYARVWEKHRQQLKNPV
jgi:hypothetical protein